MPNHVSIADVLAFEAADPAKHFVTMPRKPTPSMLHAAFGTADANNAWRYEAMIEAWEKEKPDA